MQPEMGTGNELDFTPRILFKGSKTFWKARCNLDLTIALHDQLAVLELAGMDPINGSELQRLYINTALYKQSSRYQSHLLNQLAEKKELCLRHKSDYKEAKLTDEIFTSTVVHFVLSRIHVAAMSNSISPSSSSNSLNTKKNLSMMLQPQSSDEVCSDDPRTLSVMCVKPDILQPIAVICSKVATIEEVDIALYRVDRGTADLRRATELAQLAAVDGFKKLIERKVQYTESNTRIKMLWLRVIHRVLVQQYVAKVKLRLLSSSLREWYLQTIQKSNELQEKRAINAAHVLTAATTTATSVVEDEPVVRRQYRQSSLEPMEVISMDPDEVLQRLDQLSLRAAQKRHQQQLTARERHAQSRRHRHTIDSSGMQHSSRSTTTLSRADRSSTCTSTSPPSLSPVMLRQNRNRQHLPHHHQQQQQQQQLPEVDTGNSCRQRAQLTGTPQSLAATLFVTNNPAAGGVSSLSPISRPSTATAINSQQTECLFKRS